MPSADEDVPMQMLSPPRKVQKTDKTAAAHAALTIQLSLPDYEQVSDEIRKEGGRTNRNEQHLEKLLEVTLRNMNMPEMSLWQYFRRQSAIDGVISHFGVNLQTSHERRRDEIERLERAGTGRMVHTGLLLCPILAEEKFLLQEVGAIFRRDAGELKAMASEILKTVADMSKLKHYEVSIIEGFVTCVVHVIGSRHLHVR